MPAQVGALSPSPRTMDSQPPSGLPRRAMLALTSLTLAGFSLGDGFISHAPAAAGKGLRQAEPWVATARLG